MSLILELNTRIRRQSSVGQPFPFRTRTPKGNQAGKPTWHGRKEDVGRASPGIASSSPHAFGTRASSTPRQRQITVIRSQATIRFKEPLGLG
jgi:hypothetical protein